MYCPEHFQEDRAEVLWRLIEQFPLATIIRQSPTGLIADPIPLLGEPQLGPAGQLLGHVARSNPLWQHPAGQEVLVIFQGPNSYISPNWYDSKQQTGRVVPTWNYVVVQAHCSLQAIHQPERLLEILGLLTDKHEASQPQPWRVSDAPDEYIQKMLNGVVGLEFTVHRLQGKWKTSQNQPLPNRQSVVKGLRAAGSPEQAGMANLVEAKPSEVSWDGFFARCVPGTIPPDFLTDRLDPPPEDRGELL